MIQIHSDHGKVSAAELRRNYELDGLELTVPSSNGYATVGGVILAMHNKGFFYAGSDSSIDGRSTLYFRGEEPAKEELSLQAQLAEINTKLDAIGVALYTLTMALK